MDKNYEAYKQIREWILMMDNELKSLTQSYANSVFMSTGVPFTPQIFDVVLPYTLDYIKGEMPVDEMREVLLPYEILDGGNPSRLESLSDEDIRTAMTTIKSLSLVLLKLEKDTLDIKNDASNIMNEYINYLSSQSLLKSREDKLKMFREANDLEVDENIRRINDKNINILENELSYKFLTERIDKMGYKEKLAAMDRFFDNEKGARVVNKFKASAKKFGYKPDIFTRFINIEESFLPEEYHPFNNFFLSLCMTYVGYASIDIPTDKLYVSTLISSLASLVYHTYKETEDEKKFLEIIKGILDKFMKDEEHGAEIYDRFKLQNRSYKNHPDKMKADALNRQIRRDTIFKRMEELKIENPFGEDCDVEEAREYLAAKVEELKLSQLELNKDAIEEEAPELSDIEVDRQEERVEGFTNNINVIKEKIKEVTDSEEPSDESNNSEEPVSDIMTDEDCSVIEEFTEE